MDRNEPLVLDVRVADVLQHAIGKIFQDTFHIHTNPRAWSVGRKVPLNLSALEVCQIDLTQGDKSCGAFLTAFDRETLISILKTYDPDGACDQEAISDAAEEIANMIFGQFKTKMNKLGCHIKTNLPRALGEKGAVVKEYSRAEKMIFPFLADGHSCQVVIAHGH